VTEKTTQANQREATSESHRLGVRAALWDCLDCPACATPVFTEGGCVMVAPGAKGSFPCSTEDATKLTSIIPLSSPHTRTTGFQGTRIHMAEPPWTKSGSRLPLLYCEKPRHPFVNILLVMTNEGVLRQRF
jgi:hypothetical protein